MLLSDKNEKDVMVDGRLTTQHAVSLPPTITSFTFCSDVSSVTYHGIEIICRCTSNVTSYSMTKQHLMMSSF